jgi:amidophosphoribosyltransferase
MNEPIGGRHWREECGIFAAVGVPHAANVVGLGLHALQHRGQESSGIVSCDADGEFHTNKGIGLVSDVHTDADLERLSGEMAIGHNRYSTSGGLTLENTQPLRVVYRCACRPPSAWPGTRPPAPGTPIGGGSPS